MYAKKLIGPRASFVFLMMFVLQQVLIATFAIGFASYVAVIFPDVNQKLVALGALTLAVVVNMIGLKTSAKVQKFMVALLLISLFIYIVFGLPKVDWSALALNKENIMPNGPMKFLRGAAMLSFACAGAKFLAENGGEVENPGKTIPKAMVFSTLLVAIFYALVGIVSSCRRSSWCKYLCSSKIRIPCTDLPVLRNRRCLVRITDHFKWYLILDHTFSSESCYGRMAARGMCKGK